MPAPLRLNCETIRKLTGFTPQKELEDSWVCPLSGGALSVCVVTACVNTVTYDTHDARTVDSVPHAGVPLHVIALAVLHDATAPKS